MTVQHEFSCRVYYEDTDAGGIVYYANYLKFAERARSEWLEAVCPGLLQAMGAAGTGLVVSTAQIAYRAPARLLDLLRVTTSVQEVGAARLRLRQEVWRAAMLLTQMDISLACVAESGKPVRLPERLRLILGNWG